MILLIFLLQGVILRFQLLVFRAVAQKKSGEKSEFQGTQLSDTVQIHFELVSKEHQALSLTTSPTLQWKWYCTLQNYTLGYSPSQ